MGAPAALVRGANTDPKDGTVLGSPELVPALFPQPFLCPILSGFPSTLQAAFLCQGPVPVPVCMYPLLLRKQQCWGSLLSPLNPDSVHRVAWSKIVVLFFIYLFVPQSLIWGGKKKGMDPVVESNLGALHAAWCYTFLGIYISGWQCFHSHPAATPGRWKPCSSLCWEAEPFSFQKTLQNKQVGCACSPGVLGMARPTP